MTQQQHEGGLRSKMHLIQMVKMFNKLPFGSNGFQKNGFPDHPPPISN
jgi:hypothetical protein